MKALKISFYILGVVLMASMIACSKDDGDDDMMGGSGGSGGSGGGGGGDTTMMVSHTMTWKVDGEDFTVDTILFSDTGRAHNFDGKPYVGFIPGLGITIKPGRPVGEYDFAVNGEIENASFSDASANIFIAQSGSINILEHTPGEYIKAEFQFTGRHTGNTLPDVEVTEGYFELEY